jgi:O-antigen biosynthesis protein
MTYKPTDSPLRDWLLTRLQGPRVLDLGCGTGFMGQRRPDLQWTGIDANEAACAVARRHYQEVVCADAADVTQIFTDGEPFDDVVCCDSLEHFAEPGDVLQSVMNVISPRGRLLVAIPNIVHWSVRKQVLQGHWEYTDEGPLDRTHLRFFTLDSAAALLRDAGYQVSEIGHHLAAPKIFRVSPATLGRFPGLFSTHLLAIARPHV